MPPRWGLFQFPVVYYKHVAPNGAPDLLSFGTYRHATPLGLCTTRMRSGNSLLEQPCGSTRVAWEKKALKGKRSQAGQPATVFQASPSAARALSKNAATLPARSN